MNYVGEWTSREDMAKSFETDLASMPSEHELVIAVYEYEGYDGTSFVLFCKDGQLYMNEASHCSCNGLEGCWAPEPILSQVVREKLFYGSITKGQIIAALDAYEARQNEN